MHKCIRSWKGVLNFLLPRVTLKFSKVAHTKSEIQRAWFMFSSQYGTKFHAQTEKYAALTDGLINKQTK
jgi:hypothetical protein